MTAADKIFDSENALKVHQLCYLLQPITTTRLRTFELKLGDMNGLHRSAVPWRSLTESIATIIFPTLERLDIKIEIDLDGPPFRMDISVSSFFLIDVSVVDVSTNVHSAHRIKSNASFAPSAVAPLCEKSRYSLI